MRSPLCLSLVLFAGPLLAQDVVTSGKPKPKPKPEPTPYVVEGVVVDNKGQPIEDAGLAWGPRDSVTGLDTRDKPVARSDADGKLSVRLVPETGKSYAAFLSAPGKACVTLRLSGAVVEEGGKKIRRVKLGTVALMEGVDIRGAVRGGEGKPLAGARVTASDVFATVLFERNQTNAQLVTYATSDDKGRFVLVGVPKRGATVRVTAEGHHSWEQKFVNRHTPLVAELTPGGAFEGRVVDNKGNPVEGAHVYVYYEHQDQSDGKTTKEDGKFKINLSAPGRYRVRYYARFDGASRYTYRWSKTFDGPQRSVLLQFDEEGDGKAGGGRAAAGGVAVGKVKRGGGAKASSTNGIRLKVTDAKGKQIKDYKAVSAWLDANSWQYNPGYLERRFSGAAKKSDAKGEIVVPGPRAGQPGTGRIMVKAKGFAPKVIDDVEWDEEKEKHELTIQLHPGAALAGVVVDSKTGKPVAGVKVFATDNPAVIRVYNPPPVRLARANLPGHVVTDKDGRFRIESMGDRKYEVYASHPKRPDAEPITVKMEKGKDKTGMRLEISPGAAILGKLTGAKVQLGWKVRIRRQQEATPYYGGVTYSSNPNHNTETVPVDGEGNFKIEGLARSNYSLSLVIPHSGGSVEVPIEPLRMRSRDLSREFDISEDMPGRLTGRVLMKGAALPPGRLVLLARRHAASPNHYYSGRPNLTGTKAVVSPSGQFDLPLREGKYYLSLVDMASAAILYQHEDPIRIRPTKTAKVDLSAELAMVRVKLLPENEGQAIVANRLEIRIDHPKVGIDPRFGGVVFGGSDGDRGTGIPIPRGKTELTLFLPPVSTKLLVRSSAHNLDPTKHKHNFPAQGEEELTPQPGKINKVEIRVSEPEVDTQAQGR